jgi:hypothetical protein
MGASLSIASRKSLTEPLLAGSRTLWASQTSALALRTSEGPRGCLRLRRSDEMTTTDHPRWTPSEDELEGNLSYLRRLLDQSVPRLENIPALARAARLLRPSTLGMDGVLATVKLAIDCLPQDGWQEIAELLYGLADESRGEPLKERRRLAHSKYLEVASGRTQHQELTFRQEDEPRLIKDIAAALITLVDESANHPGDFGKQEPSSDDEQSSPVPETVSPLEEGLLAERDKTQGGEARATGEHGVGADPPILSLPPRKWRPRPIGRSGVLLSLGLCLLIALALFVGHLRDASRNVIPDGCGPTTAQLFDQERETNETEIYMYLPHQHSNTIHGWSSGDLGNETFQPGEVRTFALSYRNKNNTLAKEVTARVALPQGALLLPDSTCLYRNDDFSQGTLYKSLSLIQPEGLAIGSYAPLADAVFITFSERLPQKITCENNFVETYGGAGPEGFTGDWTSYTGFVRFDLKC